MTIAHAATVPVSGASSFTQLPEIHTERATQMTVKVIDRANFAATET